MRPTSCRIKAAALAVGFLLQLLCSQYRQVAEATATGGVADDAVAAATDSSRQGYGAWGPWSHCSGRCTQTRVQRCNVPVLCSTAHREESRPCQRHPCSRLRPPTAAVAGLPQASGGAPRSSHEMYVATLSGIPAWNDELTPWSSWSECLAGCQRERWRTCRSGRKCTMLLRTAEGNSVEVQPLLKQHASCASESPSCGAAGVPVAAASTAGDDRDASDSLLNGFPADVVSNLGVDCGYRKSLPWQRIIGGKTARRGDWPWQVAVIYKRSRSDRENYSDFPYYKSADALFTPLTDDAEDEQHQQRAHQHRGGGDDMVQYCGGTLIAPQWVLTAAHCVLESGTSKLKRRLAVIAGEPDLRALARGGGGDGRSPSARGKRYEIERIYWHRDFEWERVDSDLALMRLAEPVRLDGVSAAAACLPARNLQLRVPTAEHERPLCYVLGWGRTRSAARRSSSSRLQYAPVPLVPQRTCRRSFAAGITRNQFCAGWADGRSDACDGDSGGPLVCQVTAGDGDYRWVVYGVTSFGPDDGCGVKGKYGVYVKVSNYVDWIAQIVLGGEGAGKLKQQQQAAAAGVASSDWDDAASDTQPQQPPLEPIGDDPVAHFRSAATASAAAADAVAVAAEAVATVEAAEAENRTFPPANLGWLADADDELEELP